MAGRNRFHEARLHAAGTRFGGRCVFISHRSTDKPMARVVAQALISAGIDVYFDEYDQALQAAVQRGDDVAIAAAINEGLDRCSDLLGIITKNTLGSMWVPYEIGGAEGRKHPTLHLVDKDVPSEKLPSYIQARSTPRISEFFAWLGRLSQHARLLLEHERYSHGSNYSALSRHLSA